MLKSEKIRIVNSTFFDTITLKMSKEDLSNLRKKQYEAKINFVILMRKLYQSTLEKQQLLKKLNQY